MRKSPAKFFAFVFISALLAQVFVFDARATTIVAVKTRNEIVIGADSKVTDTFGNESARLACKIVQAGGVFFAYAGFARDSRRDFDVPAIAARALNRRPNLSITQKTKLLADAVGARLNAEIPLLKKTDFPTYREKIEGRIFLKIMVVGFERGVPVILVRQFRLGQNNLVAVTNDDCGASCRADYATRFLGETDAIDNLPEETPDFWNAGLAAGVRRLVQTEIEARDQYVGAPIDILRITAKGAEWIQKKESCATISGSRMTKARNRIRR